jgi:hypothetical protein
MLFEAGAPQRRSDGNRIIGTHRVAYFLPGTGTTTDALALVPSELPSTPALGVPAQPGGKKHHHHLPGH